MKNSKQWLIITIGIIILLVLAFLIFQPQRQVTYPAPNIEPEVEAPLHSDNPDLFQPNVADIALRTEAPAQIDIPDVNTVLGPEAGKILAVPEVVASVTPSSNAMLRRYQVVIDKDIFIPQEIRVKAGDQVRVEFEAVDKDYDVFVPGYELRGAIKMGAKRTMAFTANIDGSFTFYCPSCGGPSSGPIGKLIIVK